MKGGIMQDATIWIAVGLAVLAVIGIVVFMSQNG